MKINFPSFSIIIKAIILAVVISVAGFLVYPFIGFENLPAQQLFGYAILFGVLAGAIVVNISVSSSRGAQIESIFVGNLAFKTPQRALREQFEKYGDVHALRLMTDRVTHKPRGFGFVEMARKDALAAIRGLNGKEFYGRELKVNIANERKSRDDEAGE